MFGLKEKTVKDIKQLLSKYEEVIDKAVVFGSRARGDYKRESDIDIAIFSNNITSSQLNMLRNDFDELDIIYKVDIVNFNKLTKAELKENILKDGIVIF